MGMIRERYASDQKQKDTYERRRDAGQCVRCGIAPAWNGYVMCELCHEHCKTARKPLAEPQRVQPYVRARKFVTVHEPGFGMRELEVMWP